MLHAFRSDDVAEAVLASYTTEQTLFNGSDTGLCRRPGTILQLDLQSVFAIRRGSCSFVRHPSSVHD